MLYPAVSFMIIDFGLLLLAPTDITRKMTPNSLHLSTSEQIKLRSEKLCTVMRVYHPPYGASLESLHLVSFSQLVGMFRLLPLVFSKQTAKLPH